MRLTNCMTNPREAECSREAAVLSQEIPLILWNPKVYYSIHQRPPPVLILSQINPVHEFSVQFLKIYFNIIFPFVPKSSKRSPSLTSAHQNPVSNSSLSNTCHMPVRYFFLDLGTRIIFGVQYRF